MTGRTGKIYVISAPSGAGKTTLYKELIDFFPDLRHSVSYTTRPQRAGETDGSDYHFVSVAEFEKMVAGSAFAEWAEVHGNCYGTSLATLRESISAGEDILLDIDCQGAAQLKRTLDNGVFVFILPPDFDELRRRLQGRNTEAADVVERRIENARREVAEAGWYDYIVVNDDFNTALDELKSIIRAERCRRDSMLPQVRNIFDI